MTFEGSQTKLQFANAYEAYLVYDHDHLSSHVVEALKTNIFYTGTNRFGSLVKKVVQIYEHTNGAFKKVA